MKFGNTAYDRLKFTVMVVLPAAGALYAALAGYWDWPNTEEVVGSIAALATFLGVVLQISTAKYNANEGSPAGYINVPGVDENGMPKIDLTIRKHPEDIMQGDTAVFKVGQAPSPPNLPLEEH
jgi:hypothetical protein